MKRCPTCDRTFEDSMRFCQSDGTPLADDAPPLDPYKTMVARPEEFSRADSAIPSPGHDEVLEIPAESDPNRTRLTPETSIRRDLEAEAAEHVIDIPPLVETQAPEPPKFHEPEVNPPTFGTTTPPIPSPFGERRPSSFDPPPAFNEPEPFRNEPTFNPFDAPGHSSQPEWAPPSAPVASWQSQQIGQNTPFQPSMSGVGGENKTIATVGLVLGILSIPCCGFLTGIPAIILGFVAKGKIAENSREYGGAGLAQAAIITGAIGTFLGIILILVQIFLGGLGAMLGG